MLIKKTSKVSDRKTFFFYCPVYKRRAYKKGHARTRGAEEEGGGWRRWAGGEGTRTGNKQRKKKNRKKNKEKRRILRTFQPFLSTMKSGLAKHFTKTS